MEKDLLQAAYEGFELSATALAAANSADLAQLTPERFGLTNVLGSLFDDVEDE